MTAVSPRDYVTNALDSFEEIKHSTTMVEHASKIVLDAFDLFKANADWTKKMSSHLTGLTHLIDGVQVINPIYHFFLSSDFRDCSSAFNVFMGAHLFVSFHDLQNMLSLSNVFHLGQQAAEFGRKYSVFGCLTHLPINSFISVGVITMFTALGKDAWDRLSSRHIDEDETTEQYERRAKRAIFDLAYSTGTVAVVALGFITAESLVPLNFTVQVIGLFGSLYGAYNP